MSVPIGPIEPLSQTPNFTETELGQFKEQDRFLPIANVARIMKRSLPDNVKIAKEAKESVQECVSEFISFITSEAQDRCLLEKRKTINGEDLIHSMSALGFENYSQVLKIYLAKLRQHQSQKNDQDQFDEEDLIEE
ncbi:histone-fold-containing protein [Wallemia mellicola CBS 633.66]|uniref:Histone-fold-containing protein n=1 Tax=Wallemia mellicola (strain ATCC MYA-4683 / CBS 633.66) TaxID=671144 RepID=I4Y8M5_WALMC|nr:histone-fold-containing protein [Wallemia mellicola CBS 633.66]EIM20317.1 histone-fold-containing protein [Wallemia mellicola CBS 633.66]TIC57981.1 histone-fold-containing protein [Wallemia mellicola]|eukprot:XP_006959574.1 histone-fold-containing protein [Wallemia mellicola CBS 633.66]